MSNKIQVNAYDPYYPKQPDFNPNCGTNELYQTIPEGPAEAFYTPTAWETVAAGPASIKHLYTGVPNYYPPRKITRPVDTLYGHDYSQYHRTGVGRGKRISYQYKVYPLTNRNVREERVYADYVLPYMDISNWTHHPVIRDNSLNSPLQTFPFASQNDPFSND